MLEPEKRGELQMCAEYPNFYLEAYIYVLN